ncbi:MAG: Rrf2 family transcriptional regulator [Chloroflexi bacterium]|nr:Rrf2 family transcriptional regulator [Chloroflexota bacterium]
MIRVNRQTDYAIRVLLALARRGEEVRVSTPSIQQEMLIPPALAGRIVADLARGGFIFTYAGREGGIRLARPAHLITLLQVVEFFEGPIHFSGCMDGDVICPFEVGCPVRLRWSRLDGMVRLALDKITFAELAADASDLEEVTTIPSLQTYQEEEA